MHTIYDSMHGSARDPSRWLTDRSADRDITGPQQARRLGTVYKEMLSYPKNHEGNLIMYWDIRMSEAR